MNHSKIYFPPQKTFVDPRDGIQEKPPHHNRTSKLNLGFGRKESFVKCTPRLACIFASTETDSKQTELHRHPTEFNPPAAFGFLPGAVLNSILDPN